VTATVLLPEGRRQLREPLPPAQGPPPRSRVAYAAAHVVADPGADNTPGAPAVLDWDATLAIRHDLWRMGFGVADAMDTAQRGMGLDWPAARELIRRSGAEARAVGGRLACGAVTDQLPAGPHGLDRIKAAYEEQLEEVEAAGATVVLMASRHLAAAARSPDDYRQLYGSLLEQARQPVILHWLGTAFDPALAGYWGCDDLDAAADVLLGIIEERPGKVDGVKVSLLDEERELALRARLPVGVRLYTGDDFHYDRLIVGDATGHSDALLGIFDGIGPAAASALRCLDHNDVAGYRALIEPTIPLARRCFAAPTYRYKTGLAFLAWICGRQPTFAMVDGQQSARSPAHLVELFRLADDARLFPDPELAARRLECFLGVFGEMRL